MGTIVREGYTFDDVLLIPNKSEVLPRDVDVRTRLTRRIALNIPIVSAAMDTVTEAEQAIALAREGGIGIIHKNNSIDEQAAEVDCVKRSESGMIMNPITLAPERQISEAMELMRRYRISGIPILDGQRLVGILTNRDLRFETNMNKRVSDLMTKENLVTVPNVARSGGKNSAGAPHRKAAGRRQGAAVGRADNRQGHPKPQAFSECRQR